MTFYEQLDGPLGLHRFMQESVGMCLRDRYRPEGEVPDHLKMLAMQVERKAGEAQLTAPHLHTSRQAPR